MSNPANPGSDDGSQEPTAGGGENAAPAAEIKAKLAKVREVRKANEAKLEAAQEDLRKILSVQQEAVAVMTGLLK